MVHLIGRKAKRFVENLWAQDNGFSSQRSMEESHSPILKRVRAIISTRQEGIENTSVCDLGCGNGTLMRTLSLEFPLTRFCGIEQNAETVRHARIMSVNSNVRVWKGDLLRPDATWARHGRFTIALVMAGYLLIEKRALLEGWLTKYAERTIVYAYEDDILTFRAELSTPSFTDRFQGIEFRLSNGAVPRIMVAEYVASPSC